MKLCVHCNALLKYLPKLETQIPSYSAGDLGSSRNCSGLGAGAVGPSCGRRMVLSDVCAHHERAECVVEFSGDFTSIVSEVGRGS